MCETQREFPDFSWKSQQLWIFTTKFFLCLINERSKKKDYIDGKSMISTQSVWKTHQYSFTQHRHVHIWWIYKKKKTESSERGKILKILTVKECGVCRENTIAKKTAKEAAEKNKNAML